MRSVKNLQPIVERCHLDDGNNFILAISTRQ
jgi:hypothetical protein